MRLTCFSIAPGLGQSARRGERQQFLVRAGVPQEERKPRSQFQIGESELRVWRSALAARECRDTETRGWPVPPPRSARFPDRRFRRLRRSRFVERHQAVHIVRRDRPPECAARQVFRDLPGAGRALPVSASGSQTKISARLAVFETPVGLNGPVITTPSTQMRHAAGGAPRRQSSRRRVAALRDFRRSPHGSGR